MIFGFQKIKLFSRLEQSQSLDTNLDLRAILMNKNEIKFLIRYECEHEGDNSQTKHRFARYLFNMET